MSSEKDRIISAQQRTIAKYERALSEIRTLLECGQEHAVGLIDHKRIMAKSRLANPYSLTRQGEPVAIVLPIKELKALGVISE